MKILDFILFVFKIGIIGGLLLLLLLIVMPDNVINAFDIIKGLLP